VPTAVVAEQLGRADTRTTEKQYAHLAQGPRSFPGTWNYGQDQHRHYEAEKAWRPADLKDHCVSAVSANDCPKPNHAGM